MSPNQAIELACQALEKQIQRLAVDANLYERYGVRNATAVNAFKQRERLKEAKKVLLTLASDPL